MGGNTEQNTLNVARDDSRGVEMKTSTVGGFFSKVSSKPMTCLGEVQAGKKSGGDALNSIRGEYRVVTILMSTQENSFQEVAAEVCATTDVVGVQMKSKSPGKINKKTKVKGILP